LPGCNFWAYVHPDSGLCEAIPADNPLGWTYLQVLAAPPGQDVVAGSTGAAPIRPQMIAGLDASAQHDVLVGCYSEWIRSRAVDAAGKVVPDEVGGLVVQFGYGRGRVVVSMLELLQPAGTDPVAAIMLQKLIDYCFSEFEPQTRLPLSANGSERP